jgi:hypothetical protein
MAKINDPQEEQQGDLENQEAELPESELPEQRNQRRRRSEEEDHERHVGRQERLTGDRAKGEEQDPTPRVTVIGRMDGQIAVRLGWRKGMVAISLSRFRFLREDLGLDIYDSPEDYLF